MCMHILLRSLCSLRLAVFSLWWFIFTWLGVSERWPFFSTLVEVRWFQSVDLLAIRIAIPSLPLPPLLLLLLLVCWLSSVACVNRTSGWLIPHGVSFNHEMLPNRQHRHQWHCYHCQVEYQPGWEEKYCWRYATQINTNYLTKRWTLFPVDSDEK